ncbi:hypothetical protein [Clostridium sp.]|uniref:hypothetical protein n=1 Tax=Clostridium sp. TaxID=1506 RepID=UPI0039E9E224
MEYINSLKDLISFLLDENVNIKNKALKENTIEIKSKGKEISLLKKAFSFGKGGIR